jgi:hypothetical protein
LEFVVVRRERREEGVKDQRRYWVDVRYRSSSDMVGYIEEKLRGGIFIVGLERGG